MIAAAGWRHNDCYLENARHAKLASRTKNANTQPTAKGHEPMKPVHCFGSCALLLASAMLGSQAAAEMNLTLSGRTGSSLVAFSLDGSSTATSPFGSYTGQVFNIEDGSDPFPSDITNLTVPSGVYALTSGNGTVTNATTGESSDVNGIVLQDSGLFGVARFGVDFDPPLSVATGDLFTWKGSGVIDLSISNLTLDDLTPGFSTGTFFVVGGFEGTLTITTAPEPSTSLIAVSAIGLFTTHRRQQCIASGDKK